MAEILNQEFVQALRAKGLSERHVLGHVVRNVAPTVLAVMGLQLGYLLGGSILIETVFTWPGTGFLLNTAIFRRDIPMLQGTILVLALFFVVLNLIVDLIQTAVDPAHQEGLIPWPTTTLPRTGAGRAPVAVARLLEQRVPPAAAATRSTIFCLVVLLAIILSAIFAPWWRRSTRTRPA